MYGKRLTAGLMILAWITGSVCSAQLVSTNQVLTAEQVEDMKIAQTGALVGIGARLDKSNNQIVIASVFAGSPAERSGLKAGMVVTAVDGHAVGTQQLADVVKLIRGPTGSKVELIVTEPAAAIPRHMTIVRDRVQVPVPCAEGRVLDGNIGLLTIPSFAETTSQAVRQILQSFSGKGVQGIVVDLRGNGGGSLSAARDVAGLFVGRRPILWLTRKTGAKQVDPAHASVARLWEGSVVVLVAADTSSGAELFASALQTSERAKVVGQKTFGSCSLRSIEPQPDGSAKKVVIGTMLTAGGDPIDGVGIQPDIALDANLSKEEILRQAVEILSMRNDKKRMP